LQKTLGSAENQVTEIIPSVLEVLNPFRIFLGQAKPFLLKRGAPNIGSMHLDGEFDSISPQSHPAFFVFRDDSPVPNAMGAVEISNRHFCLTLVYDSFRVLERNGPTWN
jgi:hypothetical protein